VHWAALKKTPISAMIGGDLLLFFENFHYDHMPALKRRKVLGMCRHYYVQWRHFVLVRVKLRYRIWRNMFLKARHVHFR
jgi:hypothetical protein